jgi:hypothetical protein
LCKYYASYTFSLVEYVQGHESGDPFCNPAGFKSTNVFRAKESFSILPAFFKKKDKEIDAQNKKALNISKEIDAEILKNLKRQKPITVLLLGNAFHIPP